MSERVVRILVMVPRSMMPIEVDEAVVKVRAALTSFLSHDNLELTDSVAWYRQQFAASGSWESWIWNTVTGKDYGTREPHFNGFLVYGERLGRASATIVDLALRAQRAVLALKKDDQPIELVQRVELVDETDMVSGWRYESTRPTAEASDP